MVILIFNAVEPAQDSFSVFYKSETKLRMFCNGVLISTLHSVCSFSDCKHSLSNSEKYQTKIERKEGGLHNIEDLQPQKYGNIPLDNPKDIKKIKISKK